VHIPNKGKNVPIVGRKTEFALMVAVFIVVKLLMLVYWIHTSIERVTPCRMWNLQTRISKKK